MNSERWQQVKVLFDEAIALEPPKRGRFLSEVCKNDEQLRREIETLLDSFDEAESFMESPAVEEVASLIVERKAKPESGARIAHYEIISQIGEGGMGEVYLAKDTRLNRKVALKILPANLTSDRSRLQRFKQEAQAASNLNHPNIITIYEIREYDGTHLIATEFVEGETLRQKMSGENLKLNEILEIAVQTASALSVAHVAGVIHRDIKPENIMIRPDGIVKLLDFGLAKLARADEAKLLDASTQKLTNPGMIMGTVNYMSPEQAQGEKIDHRTDLWSLGVLLYEMLSGKLPFSGKTVNHTLVAIMEQKPEPLRKNNPSISAELEKIVIRLLAKEPKNRYQTANELLANLRKLQAKPLEKPQTEETKAFFDDEIKKTSRNEQFVSLIAVLPFSTLGLSEDEEYLGLGLADALITQLSQSRQLNVRPTNAVRNFTDKDRDAAEIGRKLNVEAILEGNLQKMGERLRVTVQLINVETKATLWADKFNVDFTDFFEVQDQIAEQVSKTLLLKLNSSEQTQINKRFTENNAAYLEYLKGRHFWEKRDIENLHKSVEHFKKAIDLDPAYALAYVGLSDGYCMLGVWAEYPQDEIFPRAKAAALRALEIDEKLADAHASLGRVYSVYEWDWTAAENAYRRAIELNPNCMNAHSWLAKVYVLKHRFDEAIEESRIAQTLDPLSPQPESSLCAAYFYARRYHDAIEKYRGVLRMHADFVPALFGLGMSLAEIGEFDEAIQTQSKAVELAKNHPLIEAYLAQTYAYSGNREKALEFIEKLEAMDDKLLDYQIAAIYSRLNEKEKAFEYLEKAFAVPDRELSGLSIEPEFDNLRDDPRFNEMLERIGLPEAVKFPTSEQEKDKPTGELTKNKTVVQAQITGDEHFKTAETAPRKFAWFRAVLGLIILFAMIGTVWFYLNGGNFGLNSFFAKKTSLSLQTMKINRLSDTSQATDVAISPDGEFVVFVKEENGRQSLWLKQISAASSIQIAPSVENLLYGSPAFSADGSYIYYLKTAPRNARATLYQIPKLGGGEKKLVENISFQDSGSSFSLSPDGKQVAFIRLDEGFNRSLVITDLDGSNERRLISRKLPEYLTGAAFSPDGKTIAAFAGSFDGKGGIGGGKTIVLVNAADAAEKSLSEKRWAQAEGLAWLEDASGLIVSAAEKPGLVQLWHISNPDGAVSRITNDLSDYAAPSLTAKSSTIAAVQENQNSHIWIVSLNQKETQEKQLTFENGGKDGSHGVSFMPDGGIVYTSQTSGSPEIWMVNSDGSSNKQLTANSGINYFPSVSPDGKYIVFNSDRSGEIGIWRIDADGGNLAHLTNGSMPSFSPDGQWIYFYRVGGIWKISVEGGESVKINIREKDLATAPVVSPDNSMIACNYLVGEPNTQFRIGILPISGGEPLKIFDTFTFAVKTLRWMPDSRSVSFIDTREGVSNISSHSLDGEKTAPVTNFKSGNIWDFDWSKDGKKLAVSRGNVTKDVVLISDFRY